MKLFASILIIVSLVLGTVAATTAYVPRLESIDPADRLTLAAPAGLDPDDASAPLVDPGASNAAIVLDAAVLERLSAAGVGRVRVKEFAFGRWDHGLLFLLAAVGLILGAVLMREHARRTVSASVSGERHPEETPEHALETARDDVERLRRELPGLADDEARMHRIVDTLDELHRTHLEAFVEARPLLVARLGAAGYARLMDRYAAAERQLNRAWSAAADRVLEESMRCLDEGARRLEEALERLER